MVDNGKLISEQQMFSVTGAALVYWRITTCSQEPGSHVISVTDVTGHSVTGTHVMSSTEQMPQVIHTIIIGLSFS